MKEERNIAVAVILTLVTCGIYGIYWFIVMTNDVKEASGDDSIASGGLAFLLTLVTCGIYGFYWAYKMGELMKKAQEKHNVTVKDNAVLYLILQLFGLSIVNYCLIQSDLNEIVAKNK